MARSEGCIVPIHSKFMWDKESLQLASDSDSDIQERSLWRLSKRTTLVVASLAAATVAAIVCLEHTTVAPEKNPAEVHPVELISATATCGSAPQLEDGQNVGSLISQNGNKVLIIANPQMRCTQAVEASLKAKRVLYQLETFQTSFQYTPGQSAVWDWLHCTYPNDDNAGTTMHSYVFLKSKFLGQGFAAAQLFQSGQIQIAASAPKAPSCAEQYPQAATTIKHFMDAFNNKVLLFGWLACPCTAYAQSRFADASVCYGSRTWADPNSQLMLYLQCKEAKPNDHSFIYFRQGSAWRFAGNGFQLAEGAMPKQKFDSYVSSSGALTNCEHASVKHNVYGTSLEECRVGGDMMGSWQDDGTCSEQIGGVHEICIESLPADFSTATHQPPWSQDRAGRRHCVCVGAWSLYMTDASKHPENAATIMPHCKAIPETALTKRYLSNWKDWNGYPASVVKGVGELISRCLKQQSDLKLSCGLKQRFDALKRDVPELKQAVELQDLESELGRVSCTS